MGEEQLSLPGGAREDITELIFQGEQNFPWGRGKAFQARSCVSKSSRATVFGERGRGLGDEAWIWWRGGWRGTFARPVCRSRDG